MERVSLLRKKSGLLGRSSVFLNVFRNDSSFGRHESVVSMKSYRVQNTMLMSKVSQMPCAITGTPGPNDPHHVKSKKSGGPELPWNLCPLKHELHREFHNIGINTFANKYPKFKTWLLDRGWTWDEFRKKWHTP